MTDAKTLLVQNWLTKAQHDLESARVLAANERPLLDTAIYHCQQSAEKAVKGFLVHCDEPIERVHDIEVLIRSAMRHTPEFADWIEVGIQLTPMPESIVIQAAIEPTASQFNQALAAADGLYQFVLSLLPEAYQPTSK